VTVALCGRIPASERGVTTLSPRQREILALVAAGRTSKEIASSLGISESTVNWHLTRAFARLGASSRAEAVAIAMRDRDATEIAGPAMPHTQQVLLSLAFAMTLMLGVLCGALLVGPRTVP
jgi:DNA-binding CsgD family transcriptional regulator